MPSDIHLTAIGMHIRIRIILGLILFLLASAGCSSAMVDAPLVPTPTETKSAGAGSSTVSAVGGTSTATLMPTTTQTATPTPTATQTPTPTQVVFEVGQELTIAYLRELEITGSEMIFEQELTPTVAYRQHLVSYLSEGNKIYGLLTIPTGEPPEGGFKAIVFNHGYIPPTIYRTTERYTAHVDYLARNGFVVFKIDYRGHGESEGRASGSYFSPGYTIDSIAALKSLQRLEFVDPKGIGMWGHSMAGNLVLRAMLIEPDVRAGVIWAGAVYSYDDFAQYGINDYTYRPPPTPEGTQPPRLSEQIFETYGRPDLNSKYWQAVSLTENLQYLINPLQLHHAQNDTVVNIAYSEGLAAALQKQGLAYEFFPYPSGGHNLLSPAFSQAMQRTLDFFREHLDTGDPK